MLKQFTKTICHYPLAEKKINSKPLTHHSHSHSHMLLYFPCLIFHLFVLCYILGFSYRIARTLGKKSYRKKLYFFILTYWNWNKSFFSTGYASESLIVYVFEWIFWWYYFLFFFFEKVNSTMIWMWITINGAVDRMRFYKIATTTATISYLTTIIINRRIWAPDFQIINIIIMHFQRPHYHHHFHRYWVLAARPATFSIRWAVSANRPQRIIYFKTDDNDDSTMILTLLLCVLTQQPLNRIFFTSYYRTFWIDFSIRINPMLLK